MKKISKILLVCALPLMLGSCGIFKDNCHCPTFGQQKINKQVRHIASVPVEKHQ